jgi:phytoene dehydrogenase-like protein
MAGSDIEHHPSVIIIGAGIGGLSTGCYLGMNGYRPHIVEMGSCCGGVSVAWRRGHYLFDGATNWLPGSGPQSNLHLLLKELIDFRDLPVDDPEVFIQVEHGSDILRVYTDADRLEREMARIAPEDQRMIAEFTAAVRKASRFVIPFDKPPECFTITDYLRFPFENLPFLLFFAHWRRITIREFAAHFSSPVLRSLFEDIFPHHHFFSLFSIIMALGWMHARSGGYPYGGSNRFADLLEQRFRQYGGSITFNRKVTEIIVEGGRAAGVRCSDGTVVRADRVISAADGYATIFGMLGGRFISPALRRLYDTGQMFPSLIQIGIGVNKRFSETAHKFFIRFEQPLNAGGDMLVDGMMVRVCDFDPVFAPPGKTAFVIHLRVDNWRWWTDLRTSDPARYRSEKDRIAREVLRHLDKRFGGAQEHAETFDVATPATFIRYTGIRAGSYQSWAPTPPMVGKMLPKTVPGLRNFHMAGQWVWPAGGLPGVIRIGRNVTQIICKEDRRQFTVTLPAGGACAGDSTRS